MADLTIHTPSGIAIEIELMDYLPGTPRVVAAVPSKGLRGEVIGPAPLREPQNGATHYIRVGKAAVGLNAVGVQQLADAVAAYKAAWRETGEGRKAALRAERERLALDVSGARAGLEGAGERAWERGSAEGWAAARSEAEAKLEATLAALQAWDEAHPEVVAEIEAEQAERTARHMWD